MKQLLTLGAILLAQPFIFAQQNAQLISIAKTYSTFMFANDPDKQTLATLKDLESEENSKTIAFVKQCITRKNKLMTADYLTLPDDQTLKKLYTITEIHRNLLSDNPLSNDRVADSLTQVEVPRFELIDNYYGMLFMAVGNKNQPINLSKFNLDLNNYNLANETEKGILYLRCMDLCGTLIWGYINIAQPANTKEALKTIEKFPKFSGQPYYVYHDFFFEDFQMEIISGEGLKSYKSYYLNKLFETLLSHTLCLINEKAPEEEVNRVLLGSILPDERLYNYTELKETLEGIFSEVEQE